MKAKRFFLCSSLFFCTLVLNAGIPQADERGARIIPVNAEAYGNGYGEWSARWWQWLLSIPEARNPAIDTTGANCAQKQSGPVWFLAGLFNAGSVTRICTVPSGKALFFPIVNATFGAATADCKPTDSKVECNIADLRLTTAAAMDRVSLTASIDGEPLANLREQRVQSPVLMLTYPAGAVFGFPAGTFAPNVSDGYWLMVPPLPTGAHRIQFKGVIGDGPFAGVYDVTYKLFVEGKR